MDNTLIGDVYGVRIMVHATCSAISNNGLVEPGGLYGYLNLDVAKHCTRNTDHPYQRASTCNVFKFREYEHEINIVLGRVPQRSSLVIRKLLSPQNTLCPKPQTYPEQPAAMPYQYPVLRANPRTHWWYRRGYTKHSTLPETSSFS